MWPVRRKPTAQELQRAIMHRNNWRLIRIASAWEAEFQDPCVGALGAVSIAITLPSRQASSPAALQRLGPAKSCSWGR